MTQNSSPSSGSRTSYSLPRIAIPEPTSTQPAYNQRSWSQYAHAVESAGGIPVPVPLGESQATLARIANSCAGILLPGSPADVDPEKYGQRASAKCGARDPVRESADDLLLQDAFNLQKPIFGICYGLQSLNTWRNGSLIQDLPQDLFEDRVEVRPAGNEKIAVDHDPGREISDAHEVTLLPASGLWKILAEASDVDGDARERKLQVNSSHHQAVDRPGDQLAVVAVSPADGVIEALEGIPSDQFVLGVQWHPERSYDASAASRALFRAFIAAAREWQPRPIRESIAE